MTNEPSALTVVVTDRPVFVSVAVIVAPGVAPSPRMLAVVCANAGVAMQSAAATAAAEIPDASARLLLNLLTKTSPRSVTGYILNRVSSPIAADESPSFTSSQSCGQPQTHCLGWLCLSGHERRFLSVNCRQIEGLGSLRSAWCVALLVGRLATNAP